MHADLQQSATMEIGDRCFAAARLKLWNHNGGTASSWD